MGYLGLALLAQLVAGSLLYHPQRGSQRAPFSLRKISAGTGGELAVLYLPNAGARFTLWYLHGNAENFGDLEPQLRAFRRAGYAVFAFDYPGYGHSSGRPSEAAIFAAAQRAGNYLRTELKVPAAQTLLYGFSLGGGPAVQLATEEKFGGLVLQSTFLSAYRVMTRWHLLPFDQFENLRKLPGVSCPVLVLHGDADPVVSFPPGLALLAAAPEPTSATCGFPVPGITTCRKQRENPIGRRWAPSANFAPAPPGRSLEQVLRTKGLAEQGGQGGGDAPRGIADTDHRRPGAKFVDYLPAGAARGGRHRRRRINDDRLEFPLSRRGGREDRGALGAVTQAIRGIFDVASGVNLSGAREHG